MWVGTCVEVEYEGKIADEIVGKLGRQCQASCKVPINDVFSSFSLATMESLGRHSKNR